jgi:hypothetical protein
LCTLPRKDRDEHISDIKFIATISYLAILRSFTLPRPFTLPDRCWWCGQRQISRTHVFLQCMHPALESARKGIWERPDEDGRKGRRPRSVCQLLEKAKWEKPLAGWIVATGVGLLGPGKQDFEAE